MAQKDQPFPPRPPTIQRRFEPAREQLVGTGLLLLFLLLGTFGVFGITANQAINQEAPLRLEVTYPARTRYGNAGTIEVTVTNTGNENLELVAVRFDRALTDTFSPTTFTPAVSRVLAESYEVQLHDVLSGETRAVLVEVQAAAYWRHESFVEAAASGSTVRADIHSFIFP